MTERWEVRFFPALLFFSGYCGISYEVLYARLLGNLIGDQFAVVASVLLTFLLGIGIGTLVAHVLWRFLWAIEAAVGLYAVVLTLGQDALDQYLYHGVPGFGGGLAGSMAFAVVVLAIPAFLIGCSLPLFAGYLRALAPHQSFSHAYALYNLGAAATALLIEFFLLRHLGLRQTVLVVAGLNGILAVLLLAAFAGVRSQPPPAVARARFSPGTLSALAVASVASAVFQLLAVKLAECVVGPFHETFAIVLAVVFLGQAAGSALVGAWRLSFGQLMLLACGGLLVLAAAMKPIAFAYAALYPIAVEHYWSSTLLKLGFALAAMGVPAVAFGATIPAVLGPAAPGDQGNLARDAGQLLCVSSFANALGFLLMAFVLAPRMDYGPIIVLISAAAAGALLIGARPLELWRQRHAPGPWRRRAAEAACAASLFALTAVMGRFVWSEELLYLGHIWFHSAADLREALGERVERQSFKGGQDMFSINWVGGSPYFFINGFISFPLDSYSEQLAGALATIVAPRTDRAMILGLGGGGTGGTLALAFDHVDAVEINPLVVQNLFRMARWNFGVHARRNVHIAVDDGMHALRRSRARYSLIVNSVNTPLYFTASKLYSLDFLRAARARLEEDGVYLTWLDSRVGEVGVEIMLNSLLDVFPECGIASLTGNYYVLLCSPRPLRVHHPRLIADNPELADFFLGRHGIVPEWIAYSLLETTTTPLVRDRAGPRNTLDRPVLEFEIARLRKRGIVDFKRRVRARTTLERQAEMLAPVMPWKAEEVALNAEISQGGDSTITEHWMRLARAEPGFDRRLAGAREWYWRRYGDAVRTPRERWDLARRLADDGQCARARGEFERAAAEAPTLPVSTAWLASCHARKADRDAAAGSAQVSR